MNKKTLILAKIAIALIGTLVIYVMIDAYRKGQPVVIKRYSFQK